MAETGDVALVSQLHTRDQQLVRTLVIGLRTAELHDPKNAVMQAVMSDLHGAVLARLGDAPSVTVSARNQCLFVDRERLRVTPSDYANVRYLMARLDRWALPGLSFNAHITMDQLGELLVFLGLREIPPGASPPWERSPGISAEAPSSVPDSTKLVDETLRVFSSAIAVSRSLHNSLDADGHQQLRSLRHVTQTLVDVLIQDEGALLSMTTIKNFDGYLLNHSANVAVLAAALGQRLGLPKARLGELCLAALLHDLGKTLVPKDILEKTGKLTDGDWAELRRHPVEAVEILLEQGYLGPGILSAIVAGFEHHLDFDLGGYPPLANRQHRLTLVGRIIAVADCYDAITTPRPYRTVNLTPFDGICFPRPAHGQQVRPHPGQDVRRTVGRLPSRDDGASLERRGGRRVPFAAARRPVGQAARAPRPWRSVGTGRRPRRSRWLRESEPGGRSGHQPRQPGPAAGAGHVGAGRRIRPPSRLLIQAGAGSTPVQRSRPQRLPLRLTVGSMHARSRIAVRDTLREAVSMDVAALLKGREPITSWPEQRVDAAARLMSEHNIGAVPVMQDDRLAGMLSERDVSRAVGTQGGDGG